MINTQKIRSCQDPKSGNVKSASDSIGFGGLSDFGSCIPFSKIRVIPSREILYIPFSHCTRCLCSKYLKLSRPFSISRSTALAISETESACLLDKTSNILRDFSSNLDGVSSCISMPFKNRRYSDQIRDVYPSRVIIPYLQTHKI